MKETEKDAEHINRKMDALEENLSSIFPNLETVERFMERAQYSIPKEDVTSLGKTFTRLEECKFNISVFF